jgi:protocatechuate 3,4-dioxygenase, beta subunit
VSGYAPEPPGTHPPLDHPPYRSTTLRFPRRPLVPLPHRLTEVTGPLLGAERIGEHDHDLTAQHDGEPMGERIIVTGRVLDGDGRPVPNTLLEIWQANAAGRYIHKNDQWPGPLDPNFLGIGRTLTDANGVYRFLTVKPGIYPWKNHPNAWRPAHIHFSLFGSSLVSRLVTQMYFPDDPMFSLDPIFHAVPNDAARARMVSTYDHDVTEEEWALGYRWDIVLRGREATPLE